jgi:hypothetical protein
MAKKFLLVLFSTLFVSWVMANEPDDGDILLVSTLPRVYMINVNYMVNENYTIYPGQDSENSEQKIIKGISGNDGWIRFNEPITGKYRLTLDFAHYFSREFTGNEEDIAQALIRLKDEYEIVQAGQSRISRNVIVDLEGGGKYIIFIDFIPFDISE